MGEAPRLVLYSTSVPTKPKTRNDIASIKRLLDAKRVPYEEVDLSRKPEKREEMLAANGQESQLPQLHVNGKYLGDAEALQELEDFGQLDSALQGHALPQPGRD